jgi:GST-like protein
MIDLYGGQTPNVIKVLIALEELGLDYRRIAVDIMKGEQFAPAFLAISPNNRVPAIIDHAPVDGGAAQVLFESGAILIYLAERTGRLLSVDRGERYQAIEWVMWQMAGQGPMLGQLGHFRNYAPEKIPYAIARYQDEAARLYRVLDRRLEGRDFVTGAYSIADIACWPWILFREHHGIQLSDFPNVARWFAAIALRPAVVRAVGSQAIPAPITVTDEIRAVLFPAKPGE